MSRWVAALLLFGGVACTRDVQPWVDRVEVDTFHGAEIVAFSHQDLERQLREQLVAAKFKLATGEQRIPDRVKPWQVSLGAGVMEPEPDTRASSLELVLELRHTGEEEPLVIDQRQRLSLPDGDVEVAQEVIRGALQEALQGAVREAAAVLRLERESTVSLREKVASEDAALRGAAVRLLVRRRDNAALPALLERLQSPELDELRVVVGQLVELKAPESVNPLIEAASRKGPVFEREVLFAVSAIGGEDAEAYLDLIASGHEDDLLRASAEQALAELRARRTTQKTGAEK